MQAPTDTQRLKHVQDRIDAALKSCGRTPGDCQLIVVSKTQSAARLAALVHPNPYPLGENYLSEALEKVESVAPTAWHFIGPVQSNKTASIAQHFDWVHTLDREKIARRLNDQRPDDLPALKVLIQVNVDNEPTKAGVAPDEVETLASTIAAFPRLELAGLMSIPAVNQTDPEEPHRVLRELRDQLVKTYPKARHLSMGMSHDLEAAVNQGATFVRVGTAIFGPRPPKEAR